MAHLNRDSLILAGVLMVLVSVAIVFVYLPQHREMNSLAAEIATKERVLSANARKVSVVPGLCRQVEAMKSRYKDFDRRLPRRTELGGFLREISGNLAAERISDQWIEPGTPAREELFHTLPIIMRFSGPYLSLASFLKRVDEMERLTRVQVLKVGSSRDDEKLNLTIELQMNIYFTES